MKKVVSDLGMLHDVVMDDVGELYNELMLSSKEYVGIIISIEKNIFKDIDVVIEVKIESSTNDKRYWYIEGELMALVWWKTSDILDHIETLLLR